MILLKIILFGVFGIMQCVYAVRGSKNIICQNNSPHRDVDMWGVFERAVLGGRGRVLTLIKNICLISRL